jgi:GTP-binding protein HflX
MKNGSLPQSEQERCVLVGIISQNQTEKEVYTYLKELAFLAETYGVTPVRNYTQKLDCPNSRTFVGTGKLQQIKEFINENNISLVIFDDELSPSQLRNVEKEFQCRILDRTNLILQIFGQRAQTAYAKTQVELAQYEYMLPRLTGLWTHLERQRGGTGTRGGSGELQIESDRRVVRDRISFLKDELKKIDRQMATQRKNRGKLTRVSLVGYTNVGKSTIMNLISKSTVFAENKLFATLDTTVRKVVIGNLPFLLSDTVGFIRKLPHNLVESFKSTLDEVREADILLHVVDVSHPNFEDQINVVNETLKEINANEIPCFLIFNKIDAFTYTPKDEFDLTPSGKENVSLEQLQSLWIAKNHNRNIFISAVNKTNIDSFKEKLYQAVKEIHSKRYPYDKYLFETI